MIITGKFINPQASIRVHNKKKSYFSTKTYVVGTQKNRLNETFYFKHPKQMLKLMGKKILSILHSKLLSTCYNVQVDCPDKTPFLSIKL